MGSRSGATERAGNAQQVDVLPGVEAYAVERGGPRDAVAGHGSRSHVRHLRPSGSADPGPTDLACAGPRSGTASSSTSTTVRLCLFFLPSGVLVASSSREFSFGLLVGLLVGVLVGVLVGRLPVTRCGAGPVVRRPDAQLLRRRLDGHAERINTDGDGHDCQRPSCGNPRSCGHRPRPAGRQPFHRDGVPRVTTGFRRSGGASVVSRLASPDGRTGGNCPGTA